MKSREIYFYFITILIIVALIITFLLSPFVYRKLTKSYSYCNAYGTTDSELGWVLKKSHSSCLSFKNFFNEKPYFDTKIFLNQYGFRDKNLVNENNPDILFIGDSWTFGYGIDYEETFAAIIEKKTGMSVLNLGVPNYSSLQTFFLLDRFKKEFQPDYIIYLNSGIWQRALCSKEQYHITLEPCYTIINNKTVIKFPKKVFIQDSFKKFKYPSGMLTSGYNFFHFLFFIKPRDIIIEISSKLGINKIFQNAEVGPNYFSENELILIKNKEIELLKSIPSKETKFINIMMHGDDYIDQKLSNKNLINLSNDWFTNNIRKNLNNLENQGRILVDGHFNAKANELIADKIIEALELK